MEGNKIGYWQQLDRFRRFTLTAFLYLAFGIGALLISIAMILPVVLVSRNRDSRVRRVRRINSFAFNLFSKSGTLLGVFDVSFVNGTRLSQPGQLIIANHPSLLDVVFLLGYIPNANCVVKKNLLTNPFLAMQVYFADYILNDEGETLLENCSSCLKKGESIIIFPEGTRTVKNQSYKFKRGAAYLMLATECMVRPVHISCDPPAMGKKDPWYVIPERKITYCLTVMAELNLSRIRGADQIRMPLKSRRLTKSLVEWYHSMDKNGPQLSSEQINLSVSLNKKGAGQELK